MLSINCIKIEVITFGKYLMSARAPSTEICSPTARLVTLKRSPRLPDSRWSAALNRIGVYINL